MSDELHEFRQWLERQCGHSAVVAQAHAEEWDYQCVTAPVSKRLAHDLDAKRRMEHFLARVRKAGKAGDDGRP